MSAAFPPAYAHFQPVLDRLSLVLREVLAGQLAQLEQLLAQVAEPIIARRGDMAGMGGLTRHGELSNILQSELLLRTEAPMEFIRRIAEAETLYHENEYDDDGAQQVVRLIISVGPGILGHGRVLALAALFFMARVAQTRGAVFHWCYLPNVNGAVWFDELSVNTIKRFLKTASFAEMTTDEAEAARDVWARLHPESKDQPKPLFIDWIIGARPHQPDARSPLAIARAPRALGFSLDGPEPNAPRTAMLHVRRAGKTRAPMAFSFPPDQTCLSALNSPFAPLVPAAVAGAVPQKPAEWPGWAPVYMSVSNGQMHIVRLPDGLLIVAVEEDGDCTAPWFVPLSSSAYLGGVLLQRQTLSLLIHFTDDGEERLVYHVVNLTADKSKAINSYTRHKKLPSAQMFRQQHRYALPLLAGQSDHVIFHATNGKPFSLNFDEAGSGRFASDRHASDAVYANGQHRIVKAEAPNGLLLRTLRANNSSVHQFSLEGIDFDQSRLRGCVYRASHGQLAISLRPNQWDVLRMGVVGQVENRTCEFAPYETPLAFWGGANACDATIWSDARLGGDGTVRDVECRRDRIHGKGKVFELGANAAKIVQMISADDGLWAVTANANGEPDELMHLYRHKKTNQVRRWSRDLEHLKQFAQHVSMLGFPRD